MSSDMGYVGEQSGKSSVHLFIYVWLTLLVICFTSVPMTVQLLITMTVTVKGQLLVFLLICLLLYFSLFSHVFVSVFNVCLLFLYFLSLAAPKKDTSGMSKFQLQMSGQWNQQVNMSEWKNNFSNCNLCEWKEMRITETVTEIRMKMSG